MTEEQATKEYFAQVWEGFQCLYAQCPICGRWTKDNEFTINGLDWIIKGEGICKVHGKVDIMKSSNWGWL